MLLGRFTSGDAIIADLDEEGNVVFRKKGEDGPKKREKAMAKN